MKKRKVILILAFLAFFGLAVFSATQIILSLQEYTASTNVYDELRLMYEPPDEDIPVVETPVQDADEDADADVAVEAPAPPAEEAGDAVVAAPAKPPPPPRDPAEVNADYKGWLKITNTTVSYPTVKGTDNEYYLHNTFEKRANKLGAIFIDYRCTDDFSGYHTIIYGHNARNGTMFGSLYKYQDANYLDKHREIIITMPDKSKQTWRIFAARKSDIEDHAYRLNFSSPETFALFAESLDAPAGTTKILTLSTCTSGGTKEERMIIHAAPAE